MGPGSRDPDGDSIRYLWMQTQTQTGSPIVKLNAADTVIPSFIAPPNITSDTDVTFRLTVKDDKNFSST